MFVVKHTESILFYYPFVKGLDGLFEINYLLPQFRLRILTDTSGEGFQLSPQGFTDYRHMDFTPSGVRPS